MTTSKTKIVAKPASKHLNSKVLFTEFTKLTTRPQYTLGSRGPEGEITEMTEIIGSVRLEETNEHRLGLAEKVLFSACQCLELELSIQKGEQIINGPSLADMGEKPKGGQYL
jgi:hypothetical protein